MGRTYALNNVSDSSIVALAAAIENSPKPVVVVYTDDDDFEIRGRDFWTPAEGRSQLVILMSVASSIKDDDGHSVLIAATDQGLETALDIMERQLKHALLDPRSDWAEMWRMLALRCLRWRSNRGQSDAEGTRFAARQIIIDIEPTGEPQPGGPINPVWTKFLAMVAAHADPDVQGVGELIASYISGDALRTDEQIQQALGLTVGGAEAMGVRPFGGHVPDGDIAAIDEITIDPLGLSISSADEDDGA